MVRYRRYGTGKHVFLIHGFLGGSGVWSGQQIGFRSAFDTVAVDLPGFAGSPIGDAPQSMEGFASEIVNLADSLGFDRFSVIGWSFGGMIAQQLALQHSSRIDRLVLTGTASLGELPRRFESWAKTLERIELEGVPEVFERTVRTWFVSGENDPFFEECRNACAGASEMACKGAISAMRPWSARDRLNQITQRALIVVGDRDKSTTPEDSFVLYDGLPNAQICVLPGCAHGAHMEKTNIFNQIVYEFLAQPF